jgi:hypothetical protein
MSKLMYLLFFLFVDRERDRLCLLDLDGDEEELDEEEL